MPYRAVEQLGASASGVSLRTRLTLWVVGLFVVVQLGTSSIIFLYQRAAINERVASMLHDSALTIASKIAPELPDLNLDELDDIVKLETRFIQFSTFRVDVLTPDGESRVGSGLAWPESIRAAAADALEKQQSRENTLRVDWFKDELSFDGPIRVVALPVTGTRGGRYALVIATPDEYASTQVALVSRMFIIAGVIGAVASAVSGWYIAGMVIEPLRRLKSFANQLGPESINQQLHVEGGSPEVAQLTAALDAARARISDAFAAQERFLSNISHEIKTPIATLLIEAQTIEKAGLSKPAQAFVRTAEEEMRKLGKLVESFLTLTRVQDGKGLSRMTPVPVNEFVLESVSHCASMAKLHAVRLHPHLIDDEETMDAAVAGDPDLLRTMVDNLVRNAIRFTPRDGAVMVRATVVDGKARIDVEDEGPGLPPEVLPRIFDRFVQAPDELRKGRGHGLGLAIAQGVAELHAGTVKVENRPGTGARFTIELPLAYTPLPTADEHTPAAPDNSPSHDVASGVNR